MCIINWNIFALFELLTLPAHFILSVNLLEKYFDDTSVSVILMSFFSDTISFSFSPGAYVIPRELNVYFV